MNRRFLMSLISVSAVASAVVLHPQEAQASDTPIATFTIDVDSSLDGQTLQEAKEIIENYVSSYKATNSSNKDEIITVLAKVINTDKYTLGVEDWNLSSASDSAKGSLTANIVVSDGDNREVVPLDKVIDYTLQSIDSVAKLYESALESYVATNLTTTDDMIKLVPISNPNITAKCENFKLEPSTDINVGLITGDIVLFNSETREEKIVQINKEISCLELTLATVVHQVQEYLVTVAPSNNMDFNELLYQIRNYISANGSNPNIGIDWGEGFINKVEMPATETSQGKVDKVIRVVNLKNTSEYVDVPVKYIIPKLDYTADGTASVIELSFKDYKATNHTTENDILKYLENQLPDFNNGSVSLSISGWKMNKATKTSEGTLSGVVNVIQDSNNIQVPFALVIEKMTDANELKYAIERLEDKLASGELDTRRKFDDFMYYMYGDFTTVDFDLSNLVYNNSNLSQEGSIQGVIKLSCGQESGVVDVDLTLRKLSVQEALDDIVNKINDAIESGKIESKEDLDKVVDDLKDTYPEVIFDNKTNELEPTDNTPGSITGSIDFTYDGEGDSIDIDIKLPSNSQKEEYRNAIEDIRNGIESGSISSKEDFDKFIDDIRNKYPQVDIDTSGVVVIDGTGTTGGSITGIIEVGAEDLYTDIDVNIDLPALSEKEQFDKVIKAIQDKLTRSDITSLDEFYQFIDELKSKYPDVVIGLDNLSILKPTDTDRGYIKGDIDIAVKDTSAKQPVNIILPSLTEKAEYDRIVSDIRNILETSKITTLQQFYDTVDKIKVKYPQAVIKLDALEVIKPTVSQGGSIKGDLIASLDGYNFYFPTDISLRRTGGSSGGSSNHSSSDDDSTSSIGSKDSFIKSFKLRGSDNFKVSDGVAGSKDILSSLGLPTDASIIEYNWIAYKNSVEVNRGTLYEVSQNNKFLGLFIDADKELDNETQVDISFTSSVDLSNIYAFNSTLNKFVATDIGITRSNDTFSFRGSNKRRYVVTDNDLSNNARFEKDGWINVQDDWYYTDNADCQSGWVNVGSTWYHLENKSKKMDSNWFKDSNGKWYFLNPYSDGTKGAMKTGWVKSNGDWYLLGSDGALETGWVQDGSTWYYLNPVKSAKEGAMSKGWRNIDGQWYYFDSNGALVSK